MSKRTSSLLLAVAVALGTMTGCTSSRKLDPAVINAEEEATGATAMGRALASLQQLDQHLAANDLLAGQGDYSQFTDAFRIIVPPIRMKDPELAKRAADANMELRTMLGTTRVDKSAAAQRVAVIADALQEAAKAMGGALAVSAQANRVQSKPMEIQAQEFHFAPNVIAVPRGTRVTVRLVNRGTVNHEWEVNELKLKIPPVRPGSSGQTTFIVDKPGRYTFICDLDGHDKKGMTGTLVVQ